MANINKKHLLLLLQRPYEPVFMLKGPNNFIFDVPDHYLSDRYKRIAEAVRTRFAQADTFKIALKNITIPDGLDDVMSLGRYEPFSLWIPRHERLANRLINIFLSMSTVEDLLSCAVYARDRINPLLFNYALSTVLLHRKDTRDLHIPSLIHVFPAKFVDPKVLAQAREEATAVPKNLREPITIPKDNTASDLDEEHRLWYFREDLGINLHHWHWHLVYPHGGSDEIVKKDRRGELFYYMHEQVIARYNFERFSNRLPDVKRFNNLREPIPEAYFPKLDSLVAARVWPARAANSQLKDLNRTSDEVNLDVADLERWCNRIYEAIVRNYVIDESGRKVLLDETTGIDLLGNIVEASTLSINQQLYGNLHNYGHVFISFVHDPENRYMQSFGVMGDNATAMRDPVFYKWHSYINDIFQEHKKRLTPYTEAQLNYKDITVTGVQVASESGPVNTFHTFWQESEVDLSGGLDFGADGILTAKFTHLNHKAFNYTIKVNNSGNVQRRGTVRIFLAPKMDDHGFQMHLSDQRLKMIELDKFTVTLQPGPNTVTHSSVASTVTIPFERTFPKLTGSQLEDDFCGCGWPHHMLVPKGLVGGLKCQLFVMVSNYDDDQVGKGACDPCPDSNTYCGMRDSKYPDRKAMGYPFDRLPRDNITCLTKFLTPNMAVQDCKIVHDETMPKSNPNMDPLPAC